MNAASQPYNENVFFFFFVVAIWAYLVWLDSMAVRWALLCGASVGLCMLTRESGLVLLIAMGGVLLIATGPKLGTWLRFALIPAMTIAVSPLGQSTTTFAFVRLSRLLASWVLISPRAIMNA